MKSKLIKLPLILLIRNKVCGRKTIHERIWKIMKDYSFDFACSFLFAVPPSIITKETSTDMVVREGSNVTLTCKASGYPEPYVMWRREDGKNINYNGESGEFWLLIFFFPLFILWNYNFEKWNYFNYKNKNKFIDSSIIILLSLKVTNYYFARFTRGSKISFNVEFFLPLNFRNN